MPFSLIPSYLFPSYLDVTPEFLHSVDITLLLSDLDFTLGIQVVIVSNNRSSERVTEFCSDLGIPYQGHAGKPSAKGLWAAMERAEVRQTHTAMLGDKLLTDMLAANRAGVLALMVEPLGGAVTLWQKILHTLQRPFKAFAQRV